MEGVATRAENAAVVAYFSSRMRPGMAADLSPEEVHRPYESLGSHPDLVEYLWKTLGGALPVDCRRVVFGNPALVHPESKVVFGFVVGTHVCALRVPEATRAEALAAGATLTHKWGNGTVFNAADFGPEWIIAGWAKPAASWAAAAYRFAG